MERAAYDRMKDIEAIHWWFVARRQILSDLLSRLLSGSGPSDILEAGCGSGGNLEMLCRHGHVDAFEYDAEARTYAQNRSGLDVRFGALPDMIPFVGRIYDIIGIFDVLEHIEADGPTLAGLAQKLAPGGRIIVTVPAYPFLWSQHDVSHHHYRRYTKDGLTEVAQAAGLQVDYISYFNVLLFPVAIAVRAGKWILRSKSPDDRLPPRWINYVLARIFGIERYIIGRIGIPFGLSLVVILSRPGDLPSSSVPPAVKSPVPEGCG